MLEKLYLNQYQSLPSHSFYHLSKSFKNLTKLPTIARNEKLRIKSNITPLIIFLIQTSNKNRIQRENFHARAADTTLISNFPCHRYPGHDSARDTPRVPRQLISSCRGGNTNRARYRVQYLLISRLDRILAPIEPIWKRGRTRASFESDFDSRI